MRKILTLVLMLAAACSRQPEAPRDEARLIDEIAQRELHAGSLAGFVVVVARNGKIVFERGFGLRDLVAGEAMPADAVLDYFSVGKHMTAAILLRMAERDQLDLDAPANGLLAGADFAGATVTPRQLLSHSAGLADPVIDDVDPPEYLLASPPPGGMIKLANQAKRIAAPGETWWYSNDGYVLASLVAESAAGQSLATLIADELAAPLALRHFAHCAAVRDVLAPAYTRIDGRPRTFPMIDPTWFGGSGAVCGSARDLVTWWLALRGGRVLSAASLEAMSTPVSLRRNGDTATFGYGLGLRMGSFGGYRKIGHTGSASGGTSVLAEYPEANLVIAVITNTAGKGATDARKIEAELATALLGIERRGDPATPPPQVLDAAPGLYRSVFADALCVTRDGNALERSIDGERAETLRHIGAGRFSTDGDEIAVEYFPGADDGRAEWFALDYYGFPEDLGMRVAASCAQ